MIEDNAKPGSNMGADKNYDTADFVATAASAAARRMSRRMTLTAARRLARARPGIPAIASARSSEGGSKNHSGGDQGGRRKTRHRGRDPVQWFFVLTAAALQSRSYSEDAGTTGSICLQRQT